MNHGRESLLDAHVFLKCAAKIGAWRETGAQGSAAQQGQQSAWASSRPGVGGITSRGAR